MFLDDDAMLLELDRDENALDRRPGRRLQATPRPAPVVDPSGIRELEAMALITPHPAGDDLAKLGLTPASGRREGLGLRGLAAFVLRRSRPVA